MNMVIKAWALTRIKWILTETKDLANGFQYLIGGDGVKIWTIVSVSSGDPNLRMRKVGNGYKARTFIVFGK